MPNFVQEKRIQKRIIKYFVQNNIMDEKNAIQKDDIKKNLNISDTDMKDFVDDFLRESIINKLLVLCNNGYYVDSMTYKWRHKYQYIHYFGYVLLIVLFLLFAHYSYVRTHVG